LPETWLRVDMASFSCLLDTTKISWLTADKPVKFVFNLDKN
jgi:hypothetical protein